MNRVQEQTVMGSSEESRLRRLDTLSRILDSAFPIPGTRLRVGLESLLGLIPGIGDTIGAVLSVYIIFEAARFGLPKRTLLRMIGNVAVEALVGVFPIVGDIFDIAWQANVKNMALLRAHRTDLARREERSPRHITILFMVGLGLAVIGLLALSIFVLRLIYQFITA